MKYFKIITLLITTIIIFSLNAKSSPSFAQENGQCLCQPLNTNCPEFPDYNNCNANSGPVISGSVGAFTCSCETTENGAEYVNVSTSGETCAQFGNDCSAVNCCDTENMSCQSTSGGDYCLPAPLMATLDSESGDVYAGEGPPPPTICGFEGVIEGVLSFALGFAGLALFLMFIYGGFKWLTAGTNEKAVQQARGTFTWALVGLALIFGAWFILLFIENFTGIEVTVFSIPGCD